MGGDQRYIYFVPVIERIEHNPNVASVPIKYGNLFSHTILQRGFRRLGDVQFQCGKTMSIKKIDSGHSRRISRLISESSTTLEPISETEIGWHLYWVQRGCYRPFDCIINENGRTHIELNKYTSSVTPINQVIRLENSIQNSFHFTIFEKNEPKKPKMFFPLFIERMSYY